MPMSHPATDGYELPAFLESVAIPLSRENTQRDTLRSAMTAFWRYADRGVSETLMTAASAASGVDGRALWNAAREWCSVGHIEGVTDPSGSTVAILFAVPVLMYLERPEKRSMPIDTQQLYRALCDNAEWACPGDRCAILPNLVSFDRLPSTPDATRQMFNAMAWNAVRHRWRRSLPVRALPKPQRRPPGARLPQDELCSLYFAVGIAVVDTTTPLFPGIRDAERIWEHDLAATWATELGVPDIEVIRPMPYFLQSISMGFTSVYASDLLCAVEAATDNVAGMNRAGGFASSDILIRLHAEEARHGDGVRIAFSTGETALASCVWRVPPDGSYETLFASIRHLSRHYGFRMDKSMVEVSPSRQKRLC